MPCSWVKLDECEQRGLTFILLIKWCFWELNKIFQGENEIFLPKVIALKRCLILNTAKRTEDKIIHATQHSNSVLFPTHLLSFFSSYINVGTKFSANKVMEHRMNDLIQSSIQGLENDPGVWKQNLIKHLGSISNTQKSNGSQIPL